MLVFLNIIDYILTTPKTERVKMTKSVTFQLKDELKNQMTRNALSMALSDAAYLRTLIINDTKAKEAQK